MFYSLLVIALVIYGVYVSVTIIRDVVGERGSGVKLEREEKTLVTVLCLISIFLVAWLCSEVYLLLGGAL